jgi:small-conductance mechanosensitive channel
MSATFFKVGDTPVTVLGLVRVVLFITMAWWLSFWLRKALVKIASSNEKIASHTAYTLGRLIHYLIMIVGTIVALSSIGIDFSNVAWIAGALSVGIGFGLQDMVKNFVSGLVVMFEKTLKVGDYIELPSGLSGKVKEISLRSTLITTADNLEVVIPNTEFTSGRVVNWTLSDLYRRVHIPFNVALNSDKKQVVAAVLNAASQVPYTIKEGSRAPQVVLGSLDGKMAFELLVWIKQGAVQYEYGVKASYLWQIETALREHEIVLV